MKTPEEIKKGLETCAKGYEPCSGNCTYEESHGSAPKCMIALKEDAIAYIQQLEAQVPKWISVEERLPKVSDIVLAIANGKPRENITLHNAFLMVSYWGEEGWIADGFDGWDGLIVTHWMPLPPAPNEV